MHMPTDVAVGKEGQIYVADGANDRIVKFAADGTFDEAIVEPGNQKLNRPVGVAVDAADQLWIADTGNHRLLVVSPDGLKASAVAPIGVDKTAEFDPTDMAITPDGKRTYVVDDNNHRLLIRNNLTHEWTAMGTPGQAMGQFQWPFMVCIGSGGYVYVSEAIGARVQMISPTDRWAGEIGKWGVELGQFYRPKGVAVDGGGRVFVSDSTMGVIQVFNDRGTVEGVLTDKAGLPLRFEHPMGLCFDGKGQLYVVELKANRVAVVSLGIEKK
jgi:DNA-binding beta-propeller fold protein YncE